MGVTTHQDDARLNDITKRANAISRKHKAMQKAAEEALYTRDCAARKEKRSDLVNWVLRGVERALVSNGLIFGRVAIVRELAKCCNAC